MYKSANNIYEIKRGVKYFEKARMVIAMLLALSVFTFAGCGNNDSNTDSMTESQTVEETTDNAAEDIKDDAEDLGEDMKDGAEDMATDVKDGAEDLLDGTDNRKNTN